MAGASTVIYTSLINPFWWWIWRLSWAATETRCCKTRTVTVSTGSWEQTWNSIRILNTPCPPDTEIMEMVQPWRGSIPAPALLGAPLPCLALSLRFLCPINLPSKEKQDWSDICFWESGSQCCAHHEELLLRYRGESCLSGKGEGVHSCIRMATRFSGACSANNSFSATWYKHRLLVGASWMSI